MSWMNIKQYKKIRPYGFNYLSESWGVHSHLYVQCGQKVAVHVQKVLKVMSSKISYV
jgi:hypothetical protein